MIWPGDLGIAALTAYATTNDTLSMKNDLDTLFALQDSSGGFPKVGPEANPGTTSDTYHLWTLNAAIDYYLYAADRDWLLAHWSQFQLGINSSSAKIDSNGLLAVDLPSDWGRATPAAKRYPPTLCSITCSRARVSSLRRSATLHRRRTMPRRLLPCEPPSTRVCSAVALGSTPIHPAARSTRKMAMLSRSGLAFPIPQPSVPRRLHQSPPPLESLWRVDSRTSRRNRHIPRLNGSARSLRRRKTRRLDLDPA